MRPEHNDVRKLPVLSALDRHNKMTPMLFETQTRLVAYGLADELCYVCGSKPVPPLHPAQTVHAAYGLPDGGVSGHRLQDSAQVGVGSLVGESNIGQQGVGFF